MDVNLTSGTLDSAPLGVDTSGSSHSSSMASSSTSSLSGDKVHPSSGSEVTTPLRSGFGPDSSTTGENPLEVGVASLQQATPTNHVQDRTEDASILEITSACSNLHIREPSPSASTSPLTPASPSSLSSKSNSESTASVSKYEPLTPVGSPEYSSVEGGHTPLSSPPTSSGALSPLGNSTPAQTLRVNGHAHDVGVATDRLSFASLSCEQPEAVCTTWVQSPNNFVVSIMC